MKILYSAFECNPGIGSDAYVGWSWAKEMSKANEVHVLTNEGNRANIEKYINGHIGEHATFCELGIDSDYLEERSELKHEESEIVHILVSGRMMYRKGIELLLDAVSVLETDTAFVVDLYGGGHQIEDVKNQIQEKKLENRVVLHGKVPFDEMPSIYAKADILALPSLRETTGTAVIEAMANKLPVVALNQNGVKYLVGDDCGILVDIKSKEETVLGFGYALKKLIEGYNLRVKLGNNGFQRLSNEYTWEAKSKAMMEVYQSILRI